MATPGWLQAYSRTEWVGFYVRRADHEHFLDKPTDRDALALAVEADDPAPWLRAVPAAAMLRRIWLEHYMRTDDIIQWPTEPDLSLAARFVSSPYDADATSPSAGRWARLPSLSLPRALRALGGAVPAGRSRSTPARSSTRSWEHAGAHQRVQGGLWSCLTYTDS